ncbi:MAG: Hpt domain-containing protein, partial [Gammaproteobacteria bacterium]
MKAEGTIQYNSLSWVKKQLDAVMHDAQTSLSDYIEDSENTSALEQCIEHLRLVYGTLQMVEVYGAAMLAEEMELTAKAQLDGLIDKPEDVYDVLMRAMLQLPDYLEGLQAGNHDAPITLMPLMNDMRAARKEKLLSESVLFLPDVNAVDIEELSLDGAAVEPGRLVDEAKRLRSHYQLGLLDVLRNNKQSAGLKRMSAVIESLQKVTADAAVKRFWMVVSSFLEAISDDEAIENNIAVKGLLGSIDRQIKLLIDIGEDKFITQYSQEILKNVLYYVATSQSTGSQVGKVKQAYKLHEFLADDSSVTDLTASMGGINAELFDTVSQGIREDLATVKDTLEIFMQSSDKDVEQLSSVVGQIEKIADTYGMLGFGAVRQRVLDQRDEMEKIIKGESEVTEQGVMEIASALLEAEAKLDDYIAGKSGFISDDEGQVVPSSEYRKVLAAVVEEGQKNFTEAKEAILEYAAGNSDVSYLETVVQRLEEVRGACMMLSAERVEKLILGLKEYVHIALYSHQRQPKMEEQDTLADLVTSIEYYFEALSEGRPGVDQGLQTGELALDALTEIVKQYDEVEPPLIEENLVEISDDIEPIAVAENSNEIKQTMEISEQDVATTKSVDVIRAEASIDHEDYEILADDADEEIVEIFIEEAVEVLGSLHEHLPKWKNDVNDEESLTVVRRNFHTLKGSGRLIGAALIGEFSWKIESLLNRIIDKKIEVTDELLLLMDEVLAVLPQLIEQLRGNREPIPNIYQLMHSAELLSDGRTLDLYVEESADKISIVAADVPQEIVEDLSLDSDVGIDEVFEINGDLSSEDEMLLDAIDGSDDEEEITLEVPADFSDEDEMLFDLSSDAAEEIEAADIGDEGSFDYLMETNLSAEENESDETIGDLGVDDFVIEIDESSDLDELNEVSGLHMDPMLFQIYYDESNGHLRIIKDLFSKHKSGAQKLDANKDLIRALHTLFGSARTAEIEAIAEICGATEKYVVARADSEDSLIPDNVVEIIAELIINTESMLKELKAGRMPESNKPLLNKINKVMQDELQRQLQYSSSLHEVSAQKSTDTLQIYEEVDSSLATTSEKISGKEEALYSYGDVDDDLIDIFLEEAEELLEDCESSLSKLHENEEDAASINELQRHMHTLKGGARMATLVPVGDLTHVLESMVITLAEKKIEASKAFFDALHESLDTLNNLLEKVKLRQALKSPSDLIERIEAIMRGETIEQRAVERFDIEVGELEIDDFQDDDETEPLFDNVIGFDAGVQEQEFSSDQIIGESSESSEMPHR